MHLDIDELHLLCELCGVSKFLATKKIMTQRLVDAGVLLQNLDGDMRAHLMHAMGPVSYLWISEYRRMRMEEKVRNAELSWYIPARGQL